MLVNRLGNISIFKDSECINDGFKSFEDAKEYIDDNTGEFDNGDILALVDFMNLDCKFVKINLVVVAEFVRE